MLLPKQSHGWTARRKSRALQSSRVGFTETRRKPHASEGDTKSNQTRCHVERNNGATHRKANMTYEVYYRHLRDRLNLWK